MLLELDFSLAIYKIFSYFQTDKALIYRVIEAGDESLPFTDELAKAIVSLWNDKGVKKAYDMRSEYQLNDSAK